MKLQKNLKFILYLFTDKVKIMKIYKNYNIFRNYCEKTILRYIKDIYFKINSKIKLKLKKLFKIFSK